MVSTNDVQVFKDLAEEMGMDKKQIKELFKK
jgi:predicted DsbA family dithiol-disulfide isomerase